MLVILLAALAVVTGADIVAYDCQDRDTELNRVSLLRVKPCIDPHNATATTTRRIQLVQERRFTEVHLYTCLVAVQQLIQHCGMHSHSRSVAGGFGRYIHYVRAEACLNAHRFRRLDLAGIGVGTVSSLTLNGTTEVSATLEGHLDTTGKCQGVKFTVNEIQYKDVVVSAAVTIKLNDYIAVANVEENKINLRTGTVCPYGASYCFDDRALEVTWASQGANRCATTGIDVLFEGTATIRVNYYFWRLQ